jgi:type IV pilus assembly protein PilC
MPVYSYIALSPQGQRVQSEAVAISPEELRQTLSQQGLLVQQVREKRELLSFRRRTVTPEAFLLFNQEFLALVRAGLTIPEALKLAANRPESPVLTQTLARVVDEVRQGAAMSESCGRHPEIFEGPYLAALRTGEKTGDMARVLEKYQVYLRQRVVLQRKVSQALAYPGFLLITLVMILLVLFIFVLPRFVSLYADFGAQLPLPTRILIGIVDVLPYVLPGLIIGGAAFWAGWRRWKKLPAVARRLETIRDGLPLFGSIYREAAAAQIARALSALLAGGTPLVEAMRITAQSLTSPGQTERLLQATREVTEGKGLAAALRGKSLLPETAVRLVEVGEASGGLDRMLDEAAQFHEENLSHRLTRLMTLIEPILMLLMGVLVGGIIIVMYLPIFYIVDVIK